MNTIEEAVDHDEDAPLTPAEVREAVLENLTWRDWWPVLLAAFLALLLGGGLIALFGGIAPYQRDRALAGLSNSVVWLAASIIGACGTIAALMLTTVGLMEHLETRRLAPRFLFHLRLVVSSSIATIGLAIVTLLITVFPSSSGSDITPHLHQITIIYWSLLIMTSLMIGGFATVLGALYTTVGDIFRTLPSTWVEEILSDDETA